tara:strand:+ start:138 stop:332 length:195 start_codon:yes stop_codon:yes gene_type:complete
MGNKKSNGHIDETQKKNAIALFVLTFPAILAVGIANAGLPLFSVLLMLYFIIIVKVFVDDYYRF